MVTRTRIAYLIIANLSTIAIIPGDRCPRHTIPPVWLFVFAWVVLERIGKNEPGSRRCEPVFGHRGAKQIGKGRRGISMGYPSREGSVGFRDAGFRWHWSHARPVCRGMGIRFRKLRNRCTCRDLCEAA